MVRIFFVGYMGAGKTTIGKALAKQMNLSFIDLDHYIENRFHKTIRELFRDKGEAVYREIERKLLIEVCEFEDVVISTGGGVPCFFDNMQYIKSKGRTVYLKASPQELAYRVGPNNFTRPTLAGRSGKELTEFISRSLQERSSFYEQADLIYDAEKLRTEKEIQTVVNDLKDLLTQR